MKLTVENLNDLCIIAKTAALEAGKYIADSVSKNINPIHKDGGSSAASQVVTDVDYKSQEIILVHLNKTLADYDLALLTEETPDNGSRLEKDYFWCVDPLDGTLPFVEAVPGYAVSIGLVSKDGIAQIGIVYDPVEDTLYHGVKGGGAFKNGNPWQVTKEADKERDKDEFTFITSRSFLEQPRYHACIETLTSLIKAEDNTKLNIIHTQGAVMNALSVWNKAPGIYFKLPKPELGGGSLWDFAATACIMEETGAFISDIYGNPLNLNQAHSLFMNERGIIYAPDKIWQEKIIKLAKNFTKKETGSQE